MKVKVKKNNITFYGFLNRGDIDEIIGLAINSNCDYETIDDDSKLIIKNNLEEFKNNYNKKFQFNY